MIEDSKKPVTPVEAFRVILRAIYPEKPELGSAIKSYEWFTGSDLRNEVEEKDYWRARVASYLIQRNLRYCRIRAYGVLEAKRLDTEIPPDDLRRGDLHIFNATLDCSGGRIFRSVFFSKEDILRLVSPAKPTSVPAKFTDKAQAQAVYEARARAIHKTTGRWPSESDDIVWGQSVGLARQVIRDKRNQFAETEPTFAEQRGGGRPTQRK